MKCLSTARNTCNEQCVMMTIERAAGFSVTRLFKLMLTSARLRAIGSHSSWVNATARTLCHCRVFNLLFLLPIGGNASILVSSYLTRVVGTVRRIAKITQNA